MTSTTNVARLYDSIAEHEDTRLAEHPMEREMTFRSITEGLASQGSNASDTKKRIADIGGGPGRVSFRLADQGHHVDLRDLTPGLIEIAKKEQENRRGSSKATLASLAIGDALDESLCGLEGGSYDVVLLLGPLYHLMEEHERARAVQNALKLAKNDGLVYIAFVSVAAHLRDIAMRDPARLVQSADFYARYVPSGKYEKHDTRLGFNVQSFHTSADNIRSFIERKFAGTADLVELRSTEGILGGGLDAKLEEAGEETVRKWTDLMYEKYSTAEEFLGCADHLLAVLKKHA